MKLHFNADFRFVSGKFAAVVGTGLLATIGCSGGPDAIQRPDFDAADAGAKAMEIYDTDGDGFVASEELEKAPGLKAALKKLDADNDGRVSAEEVTARVQSWSDAETGLMSFYCDITIDGRPLETGRISFVPDDFLAGVVQEAGGEIKLGSAMPSVPKDKRPSPTSPPGIQAGIYIVKISNVVNGRETIPARYNTETTLGQEVAKDEPSILNKNVTYRLKSK